MKRAAAIVVVLGTLAAIAAADTKQVTVRPGLVELRITAPEGADVSWEARQPIDLPLRTYERSQVAVTCWHTAGRLIIVSDVIDWDARNRTKTTWIVDVGDGPGPDPTPPAPSKYGLDKVAADALRQVPATARVVASKLSANFAATSSVCAAGGFTTVQQALADVRQRNRTAFGEHRSAWEPWLIAVGDQFDRLEDSGRIQTVTDYGEALSEVARGLQGG